MNYPAPDGGTSAVQVLHVDDEPGLTDLVGTYLQRANSRISVETASCADDGLDRLAETDIDCVVSDYDMPGANGIEFLEAMRADYPDLPFILYTGTGSEDIASDAINAGITDYLRKESGTAHYTVLANRVINAVESYRSRRALADRNASLRRYERMVNSMPEAACIYDREGRFEIVNRFLAEWYESTPDELVGQQSTLIERIREQYDSDPYQELLDGERAELSGTIESEFPGHGEAVLEYRLTPLVVDGAIDGVVGVTRDVSECRKRKDAVHQTREEYRELFDGMNDTAWVIDFEGNVLAVNEAAVETLGYSADQLCSMTPADFDAELAEAEIAGLIASMPDEEQLVFETVHRTRDGTEIPVEISSSLITYRDEQVILSVARDISLRKERQRELETMLNQMDDSVFIHPPHGSFTFVNQTAVERYGYSEETLLEMGPADLDAPVEVDHITDRIRTIMDDGQQVFETTHRTSDGASIPVEINATAIPFRGETVILSISRDVTARKALQRNRQQIIERVTDAIVEVDSDWRFTLVNDQAATLFEADAEQLLGRDVWEVFDAAKGTRFEEEYRRAMETREPTAFVAFFSQLAGWFDVNVYPMSDGGLAFYFVDVTEQREYQRELERKNKRLEDFSSVISHDLRNPLTVANGRLSLAKQEFTSDHLDTIEDAHERMEEIIEDVLLLSREGKDIGATDNVDLRVASEAAWTIVTDDAAEVALRLEDDDLGTIVADDDRLGQLLENLFRNAIEHGDGDVTVTIGPMDGGFYVADDGPGIAPADRAHVFESGVSTDEAGTGIGLAIVERIGHAHGWDVTLTESASGGARFEITGVEPAGD